MLFTTERRNSIIKSMDTCNTHQFCFRPIQLHHTTQLACECGIPYINLTKDDWESIPDNVKIALDGDTGVLTEFSQVC